MASGANDILLQHGNSSRNTLHGILHRGPAAFDGSAPQLTSLPPTGFRFDAGYASQDTTRRCACGTLEFPFRPPTGVYAMPRYFQEPTALKSGVEHEAGTAYSLMIRYPCLSEAAFTRAKDFVPER